MSEQRDTRNTGNADVAPAKGMSRRTLLRGSVKALPVVLTLHSGAALARSSNLISGSGEIDGLKYRCLDTGPLKHVEGNLYDLGANPYTPTTTFTVINERDYHNQKNNGNHSAVSEIDMCRDGGTYYYKQGADWVKVDVNGGNPGMLVSSYALNSFTATGAIKFDQEI